MVTFVGNVAPGLSPFLASASKNGIAVVMLGQGTKSEWSKLGFQARINTYRRFVLELPEGAGHDVVLFVDGFDALLFGPGDEILNAFEALEAKRGCSLFMGAEALCSDTDVCKRLAKLADSLKVATPWKYINGGLLAGRVAALRQLWGQEVNLTACSECNTDQEWFALRMLEDPKALALDYGCELFQNVINIQGLHEKPYPEVPAGALVLSEDNDEEPPVLVNTLTGTRPLVAHFPGRGHWTRRGPCAEDPGRQCSSTPYWEAFRRCFPREFVGSDGQRIRQTEDSLWLPDFLRHMEDYTSGSGSIFGLVRKLKDRDLERTLLRWGLGLAAAAGLAVGACTARPGAPGRPGAATAAWRPCTVNRLGAMLCGFGCLVVVVLLSQFMLLTRLPGPSTAAWLPRAPRAWLQQGAAQLRLRPRVCEGSGPPFWGLRNGDVELVGSARLDLGGRELRAGGGGRHVLVTGGAGYIGSHMALRLLEEGYDVTVVDNLSRGHRHVVLLLQSWACRLGRRLAFAYLDLGDRELLQRLLLAGRPDWVMHFASLAFVAESMAHPLLYFRNVTENTLTLLGAMEAAGVRNLVYSSSCSTYGEHDASEMPITENTSQRPTSVYGRSKLMAETMIRAWADQNHDACASILRYFNVIGADGDARLGEIPAVRGDEKDSRIANALFDAASGRIGAFRVYGTDFPTRDGTAERDYVHVSDLVSAHLLMLQHRAPRGPGGCDFEAFNVGYGVPTSALALLRQAQALPGARPFQVKSFPRRFGDVPSVFADPARIKSLGWLPRYTNLTEALLTAWRFRQGHRHLFPGGRAG